VKLSKVEEDELDSKYTSKPYGVMADVLTEGKEKTVRILFWDHQGYLDFIKALVGEDIENVQSGVLVCDNGDFDVEKVVWAELNLKVRLSANLIGDQL